MAFREAGKQILAKWGNSLKWSLIVGPPLIALHDNIFAIKTVCGNSMSPTLNPPDSHFMDVVIVSKISDFSQNDVVLAKDPLRSDGQLIVKRVASISRDGASVFLVGDNVEHSTDSRHFGSLPAHLVEGVVKAIVFPPWRITGNLCRPDQVSSSLS
jgi:hypothetical protein